MCVCAQCERERGVKEGEVKNIALTQRDELKFVMFSEILDISEYYKKKP